MKIKQKLFTLFVVSISFFSFVQASQSQDDRAARKVFPCDAEDRFRELARQELEREHRDAPWNQPLYKCCVWSGITLGMVASLSVSRIYDFEFSSKTTQSIALVGGIAGAYVGGRVYDTHRNLEIERQALSLACEKGRALEKKINQPTESISASCNRTESTCNLL